MEGRCDSQLEVKYLLLLCLFVYQIVNPLQTTAMKLRDNVPYFVIILNIIFIIRKK